MKRRQKAKPGELLIWHGRLDGDAPDVVYSSGEGVPRCDRSLLHFYLGSPKSELNLDAPLGSPRFLWAKYAPSLWEELEKRGYDLSTLRFYIRKKDAGAVSSPA